MLSAKYSAKHSCALLTCCKIYVGYVLERQEVEFDTELSATGSKHSTHQQRQLTGNVTINSDKYGTSTWDTVAAVSVTQEHGSKLEQNGGRTVWKSSTHQRKLHVC